MSNDSTVKRFTYDWLIRFAELHPFSPYDSKNEEFIRGLYRHRSKFATISPLFTTVIARYMPHIVYEPYMVSIDNGIIKNYKLPALKKCCIFICKTVRFADLKPGIITLFKNNHVFFYGGSLLMLNCKARASSVTPDELKYLLKFDNFEKKVWINIALTEPMKLSEIWPRLASCNDIWLDIQNLVCDENLAAVFHKSRTFPNTFGLSEINVSDEAILKLYDYILSLPLHPTNFFLRFQQCQPTSLGNAIINRYESSGVPFGYSRRVNKTSFKQAKIWDSHGKVCYCFQ